MSFAPTRPVAMQDPGKLPSLLASLVLLVLGLGFAAHILAYAIVR